MMNEEVADKTDLRRSLNSLWDYIRAFIFNRQLIATSSDIVRLKLESFQ